MVEAAEALVTDAWALNPGVIPCVDGVPISEETALALHLFVTGDRAMGEEGWRERAKTAPTPDVEREIRRAAEAERRRVQDAARALFAVVLRIFGPIEGISLRLEDGRARRDPRPRGSPSPHRYAIVAAVDLEAGVERLAIARV